jgi:tetratricopeptide (TPR) repeat protein
MQQQSDDAHSIEYITPDQPGGIPGWHEGIPVIRLFTCGLLSIEVLQEVPGGDAQEARYEPLPAERLRGAGPAPACHLLKLLVSRPERYASKDWLMTHLREGKDERECITPRRLENIVSALRKLVCLPSGKRLQDLLTYERATHESGDGYHLAGYPLVWVDADALAWNVKQACLKHRFGDDPCPYWQRAYELASRGTFLLDEPSSEWARKQRREVQDHLRQSVHALARLYLSRFGEPAEEEVLRLLSAYRRGHPTDEDLLRLLLQLLTKRGRYGEVLEYYEALERGLAARGLTKDGKERTPHQLTQEIVDYARLKLREDRHTHLLPVSVLSALSPSVASIGQETEREEKIMWETNQLIGQSSGVSSLISLAHQDEKRQLSSPSPILPSLEEESWSASSPLFTLGIKLLALVQPQETGSSQEFLHHVARALESNKAVQGTYSRRQTIALLASLSAGLLSDMRSTRQWQAEDILTLCSASIVVCWNLFWEGDFAEVEKVLPVYIARLAPLTQYALPYQRRAASLLSQAHQIASLLVLEHKDFGSALTHCKQAFFYGELAGDPHLQVAALIRQANIYFYWKCSEQLFHTYQRALEYLKDISPLLRSRVYSGLSSAQAELGQKQEALRWAGLAHEEFPSHPEDDPAFLYTNTTRYILHFNDSSAYLHFHQPQLAWEALRQAAVFVPNEVTPRGMELQNHQVIISIALGHLEQCTTYFERLVESGNTLGSNLHQNEARGIYEQMQAKWPQEHRVKQLETLFNS